MKERILLITSMDETYRKPLLETQGYAVQSVVPQEVDQKLQTEQFELVLFGSHPDPQETLDLCSKVKRAQPGARVGVLAQRAEYIPANDCIDAIFRNQHSPGKFLASVRRLMEASINQNAVTGEGDD